MTDHEKIEDYDESKRGVWGLTPDEYYRVTYHAVRDALLDVVGTIFLLAIAIVLVWTGVGVTVGTASGDPIGVAVGVVIAIVGVYLAAATLEIVPSVFDWV
jgi:hypothetical protein